MQKPNTDANNFKLVISDSPADIAQEIFANLIVPILNRKAQHSGIADAEQVFFNLMYLLMKERFMLVGAEAIIEFESLIQQVDQDVLDDICQQLPQAVDQSDFIEIQTSKAS